MRWVDVWVDPPSGWHYGFPKIKKAADDRSLEEWLVAEGYPMGLITHFTNKWCRVWEVNYDESN